MSEDKIYFWGVILATAFFTLSILVLFFFMTFVKGAVEESDEEFNHVKISFVYYRYGEWILNVGNAFCDNAAVKIEFGWLFRYIFENYDVVVLSDELGKLKLKVDIERGVIMYRKKCRRCR